MALADHLDTVSRTFVKGDMKTRFLQPILFLILFKLCILVEPCLRAASSVAAPKIEILSGTDVVLSWVPDGVELDSLRTIGANVI